MSSRESNGIVPHLRLKGSDSVNPDGGRNGCNITNVIDNERITSDAGKPGASKAPFAVTAANGTSPTDEGEILSSFRGKTVDFPRTRSHFPSPRHPSIDRLDVVSIKKELSLYELH